MTGVYSSVPLMYHVRDFGSMIDSDADHLKEVHLRNYVLEVSKINKLMYNICLYVSMRIQCRSFIKYYELKLALENVKARKIKMKQLLFYF